jgi:hypothetical protein
LAWGAFIILIGAGWLAGDNYQIDTGPYVAFGVGLILIGLNIARSAFDLRISNFSLFIGIIAFAIGGAGILGYSLPLIPTIVIMIGLFITAEAVQKLPKW